MKIEFTVTRRVEVERMYAGNVRAGQVEDLPSQTALALIHQGVARLVAGPTTTTRSNGGPDGARWGTGE